MSRSRKGQMFTVDMIASVLIFILIVNLSMMTWNIAQRNSVMFNEERSLRDRAAQISDILIRTPGHPEDWNADNVEIIGLTAPDHVLSREKLEEFDSLSYSEQSKLLRIRQNDFQLEISKEGQLVNVSSDGGNLTLSFGQPPSESSGTVVVDERRVLVNESEKRGYSPAILRTVLWR
ncbi:MAG: hypothetical protein MUP63_00145 [Candidatus Nanohaloarchaeota archaeon QJJ-7]|nr:hypothetical protein [Candidatus Nanohaloarchaeota archaeon QJJ-7]